MFHADLTCDKRGNLNIDSSPKFIGSQLHWFEFPDLILPLGLCSVCPQPMHPKAIPRLYFTQCLAHLLEFFQVVGQLAFDDSCIQSTNP